MPFARRYKKENMKNNPLVSIVIPVYNGSNFLKKAIDSALAQTYKNIEILVVNDGSADNNDTERVALSYGDKIRYFYKENGGVSSALNLGIREMKGDYFSWLSHDDEYAPTKIEKQIEQLKFGADIIVSSECQINENSKVISNARDYSALENENVILWQEEMTKIISDKIFSGCALLIPQYIFDDVGFFDETLRYNQDFDMWMRICIGRYSWKYHNDMGVLSRVHNNQVTQTRRDLFYSDSYKLGLKLVPILATISTSDYNFLYMYAKQCGKLNLNENVKLCIQEMRNRKLYPISGAIFLKCICLYGKIRPTIRRVYYKICKNVKTQ